MNNVLQMSLPSQFPLPFLPHKREPEVARREPRHLRQPLDQCSSISPKHSSLSSSPTHLPDRVVKSFVRFLTSPTLRYSLSFSTVSIYPCRSLADRNGQLFGREASEQTPASYHTNEPRTTIVRLREARTHLVHFTDRRLRSLRRC